MDSGTVRADAPSGAGVACRRAILLVSSRDRTGLVAALSDFVFRNDGNIVDADQHAERESGMFFMRLAFEIDRFRLDADGLAAGLDYLERRFDLQLRVAYSDQRPRVAVFATKLPHCLYDLLLSHQLGELGGDIAGVISNHEVLRPVAEHFGVPFFHTPIQLAGKPETERAQQVLLGDLKVDLLVLARYMQVLSPAFSRAWSGRIINIHHSFLPAFVGARPYHQAKERGVKVIGATAHYVNDDLDQGPIIEQDVCRVSHRDDVEEMIQKGRELERQVLTRAVRLHLDRRILISGNRTIVFR